MSERLDKSAAAEVVVLAMRASEATSEQWGLKFEAAGDGWARGSMVIREDMLNGHGSAHGGMIFSLADTVFAWACNGRNQKAVAQQASISFLSPVGLGETITAEAREVGRGGRSGAYQVSVKGEDGRLVAAFSGLSRAIPGTIIDEMEKENSD